MIPLAELTVQTRNLHPAHHRYGPPMDVDAFYSTHHRPNYYPTGRPLADYARSTGAIGRRIIATNEWGEEEEYFGIRRTSPRVVHSPSMTGKGGLPRVGEVRGRSPAAVAPTELAVAGGVGAAAASGRGGERAMETPAQPSYDDDDDAFFS